MSGKVTVRAFLAVLATIILLTQTAGSLTRYETRLVQLTDGPYHIVRERDSVDLDGDLLLFSRSGLKAVADPQAGPTELEWDNATYVKDLAEGSLMKVADEVLEASLSDPLLVWREGDEIRYQNVYTGDNKTLPLPNAVPLVRPDIYRNLVVWSDRRNDLVPEDDEDIVDIYLYNITTETELRLTTNRSNKGAPTIWGDLVVWADDRNGNFDIYALNLTNGTEFRITSDENGQFMPKASSRAIAWVDTRTTEDEWREDIFYLDLTTWEERQASRTGRVESYDLSGQALVWEDTSRENRPYENGDIYYHSIRRNSTMSYFASDLSQWCPAVDHGKVVWIDNSADGGEIFTRERIERPLLGLDIMTALSLLVVVIVATVAVLYYRRAQRKEEAGVDWRRDLREKGRRKGGKGEEGPVRGGSRRTGPAKGPPRRKKTGHLRQ